MKENELHNEVWKRFIRKKYNHILDYVDEKGYTVYPTCEECERSFPNPMGWWTPVENGGFFTGLYTCALIEKYNKYKNTKTAEEINRLIDGLKLLQDAGKVKGFIVRGFASDGKSHYAVSSEDQLVPWIIAFYLYFKSSLCNNPDEIKERLLSVLCTIRDCGWKVPTEFEGAYSNSWANSSDWRGNVNLLFLARIIYELTKKQSDLESYERLCKEIPKESIFKRIEIASHGYSHDMVAFLGVKQSWICICSHIAMRELMQLDEKNSEYYRTGLFNNGVTAMLSLENIKDYDNKDGEFDIDWHNIGSLWSDCNENVSKGKEIAMREHSYWSEYIVPHRYMEHEILGNGLFAAWIAVICGDEKISEFSYSRFLALSKNILWKKLHLPYAFVAESIMIYYDAL